MDIELAVNAMDMAPHLDLMVLFSGDGDFRSLVESIQRKGVRVAVVSTISTQPPMVADELRRQADEFIDLAHLIQRIGRDPGDRPQRPADHRRGQSLRRSSSRPRNCASRPSTAAWRSTSARRTIARIVRGSRRSGPRTGPPIPDWSNAPVPSFGEADARVLIVGLAPGLRGANRTGRPFTGDYAGELLYRDADRVRLRLGRL